jgi:hypothetical protein
MPETEYLSDFIRMYEEWKMMNELEELLSI